MSDSPAPIRIATRGSALALAQANMVLAQCRESFPNLSFELKIIKTTGDKLQTASMAKPAENLPKGLFTKELEVALLNREADLAVHSLKDLPTELPDGLMLGAVGERADARDVLILRDAAHSASVGRADGADGTKSGRNGRGFAAGTRVMDLPPGAVVATSSTRRAAQLLAIRPELKVVEIRGNVATRLQKLADKPELDATMLAAAGLHRLRFEITATGTLRGEGVPAGLIAVPIDVEDMIPCVGQAAIGIEVRVGDARIAPVCAALSHLATFRCVTAERAFLRAMGGGCQSPIAAYAEVEGERLRLRAVSFRDPVARRAEARGSLTEPALLGERVAAELA